MPPLQTPNHTSPPPGVGESGPHPQASSHLIFQVVAGQGDPPVSPLAALIFSDHPEEFALLAGFTHHLECHPTAARGLVLELQAHGALGQVHGWADEAGILALACALTLQP